MKTTLKSWPLAWRGREKTFDVSTDKLPWTLGDFLCFKLRSKKPESRDQIIATAFANYGGSAAELNRHYNTVKAAEKIPWNREDLRAWVQALPIHNLREFLMNVAEYLLIEEDQTLNPEKEVGGADTIDAMLSYLRSAGIRP